MVKGGTMTTTPARREAQTMTTQCLERTMFTTSRLLEYFSDRELRYQTGRPPSDWPRVILKELMDNALDACEDARVAPSITVHIEHDETAQHGRICVADNGPGLAPETLAHILDFSTRTSDKEAYVSPTRGAQGNALKTVFAIPYVGSADDPRRGHVSITSRGVRHDLTITTDLLRQKPLIAHTETEAAGDGTSVSVELDYRGVIGCPDLDDPYKTLRGYALFNPHLALTVNGESWPALDVAWEKWRASDPTPPSWYNADDLSRLITAHIVHAEEGGRDLTVREFVSQFKGLSSTVKQKRVTASVRQRRLSDFLVDGNLDMDSARQLLEAMRAESRPVKAERLGIIGEEALRQRLSIWYELEPGDLNYVLSKGEEAGLPFALEIALARKTEKMRSQLFGLNFAPTYSDPFEDVRLSTQAMSKAFGGFGLNALLSEFKVGMYDPLVVVVHLAFPRPRFTDRGKSGLQLEDSE